MKERRFGIIRCGEAKIGERYTNQRVITWMILDSKAETE